MTSMLLRVVRAARPALRAAAANQPAVVAANQLAVVHMSTAPTTAGALDAHHAAVALDAQHAAACATCRAHMLALLPHARLMRASCAPHARPSKTRSQISPIT